MRLALALTSALALAGCTAAQTQTPAYKMAYADGQLFCAMGPTVAAIVDVAGAPVLAMGATSAFVRASCAAFNELAVPVVPPTTPVPTVAIVPPILATAAQ